MTATCGHRPGHANDGPASAFLTLDDGTVDAVATGPARRVVVGPIGPIDLPGGDDVGRGWRHVAAVAARDARLHPYRPAVLTPTGEREVAVTIDDALGRRGLPHRRRRTTVWPITAGSPVAAERALTALVRAARADGAGAGRATRRARHGVARPARRPGPPGLPGGRRRVARRRRRVARAQPVAPAPDRRRGVAAAGARLPGARPTSARGAATASPCRRCSGPAPSRTAACTRADDIARWHARADGAGHRARPRDRPARPLLRRPGGAAGARRSATTRAARSASSTSSTTCSTRASPATWPLLEAAFGELADRFPSPWLHLGGDEVPRGAWLGFAARHDGGRADRGATDRRRDRRPRSCARSWRSCGATTGRLVGVWQEAAESGALAPGRRLRRRVDARPRASAPGRRRPRGRRRAGRGVLPRHGGVDGLVRAGDELGRAARRSPTSRRSIRRPAGRPTSGPPARRPGLPVDRARPRPPDDGTAPVPAPDRRSPTPRGRPRHRAELVAIA